MQKVFTRLGLAVLVAVLLGVAGCGGGEESADRRSTGAAGAEPKPGGTLSSQIDAFEWTGNFDPTGEYLGDAHGIYSNLLIRTLMGFRHVAGPEGNELIPDLAEAEPQVSADGKTYTFKIRPGVKFSPPVDREVTAQDVLYAFKRIGTPSLVAQYGYYYNVVEGMAEFTEKGGLSAKGKNEISGISVPDDRTIVFKLTEPTGDFLFRVGMPATGPIPEEVAGCFTKAGEYGRFLISSGPYMMEGSDNLNAASCKELKPLAGFNPNQHLRLVRNPNYDEATDTKEARENFFDRFEMTLNTNAQDIFDRVKSGQLDFAYSTEPPEVIRDYTQNEDLKRNYHTDPGDRTWYITMNLTQPPFDDIHVRKAMNWVMDKEGLRRAWGGSVKGEIAQHIVPDTMFNNHLEDYAPYATEGDAGDVEKAMEEMKQSKYDTDQDGLCDAPQCKNVLHVTRTTDVFKGMVPVIEASARKIGVELTTREFEDSYTVIQTIKRQIPISSTPGWGKDYADASTFMVLFDSRSTLAEGNVNYSLLGLTKEQAAEVGAEGTIDGIPSVDADIDRCNALSGEERLTCWEDLDKKLLEEIVPWVPYLDANADWITGDSITQYVYDQSFTTPAWSHIAVDG
ncbi:MAG: hypothetical protein H0U90_11970 [Actinobacteria bacterium]|nr:hypothetical protein [Actinomycetota bacterium]